MDNTMDVAGYVIKLCNKIYEKGDCRYPISDLYLQKILYFLNVIYLLKTHNSKPLINEKFETWDYGPVLYNVYENYKVFKGNRIKEVLPFLLGSKTDNDGIVHGIYEHYDEEKVKKLEPFIKRNITNLLSYSPFDLVNKSHQEEQWKTRTFRGQIYSNKLSYDWYSENPKRQFWNKPKEAA